MCGIHHQSCLQLSVLLIAQSAHLLQLLQLLSLAGPQVTEEQAALDALSELGVQQQGAESVLLHPSHVMQDIASKALGRAPSPDITLAALHALATIAGLCSEAPKQTLSALCLAPATLSFCQRQHQ